MTKLKTRTANIAGFVFVNPTSTAVMNDDDSFL